MLGSNGLRSIGLPGEFQYHLIGLGLTDLIDEGNIGLVKAAEKFDETRFEHPFTPKMKITHGIVREEQYVDLPETFNYLIGLYVDRYEWPMDGMQVVSGETRRDEKGIPVHVRA